MPVIRAEQWRLLYAPEVTYGSPPAAASYTGFFGVVQDATLPDVQTDFQSFYGLGTNSVRNWYVAYRGKQAMSGSISNFSMLNGSFLYLPFGGTSAAPSEANELSSFSLHAQYMYSDGSAGALIRRFHGGKVNRMTISASEGGFLTGSIDEMLFSSYSHNASGASGVPHYVADLTTGIPVATATYSCEQPWLFSGGTLSLWGTPFARVRNFRISVNNACQTKYYITSGYAHAQLPYEIREGKRDYSMTCTVDIEDSSIYAELLNQGGGATGDMTGFVVRIAFTRTLTSTPDVITITSPAGGTVACGGDAQGCFIKQAPHNISTGENLVSVPMTIMMRSVGITLTS